MENSASSIHSSPASALTANVATRPMTAWAMAQPNSP